MKQKDFDKLAKAYAKKHHISLAKAERQIKKIYARAINEAVRLATLQDLSLEEEIFAFASNPILKPRAEKIFNSFAQSLHINLVSTVSTAWTLANSKNDELCDLVFASKHKKLSKEEIRRYYSKNEQARQAFLERKVGGIDLSERIWRYKEQFRNEVEMALDLGIRSGRSADAMARDIKQYLKEPNKLFRRVRDEHGELQLSKRAKAYHPGQGVYRSSYKNARRFTVTEGNIAYHKADQKRREALDFIVGVRIQLSNNHTLNGKPFTDICDDLKGDYPKDFEFTGWHPLCRCSALAILKTDEELARDTKLVLQGRADEITDESVNKVSSPPPAFNDWLEQNAERIDRATKRGTLPYFIKDNPKYVPQLSKPSEAFKLRRKEIQISLKKSLVEHREVVKHRDIKDDILFTTRGIKEALNQPHKYREEKNEAVAKIKDILPKSKYISSANSTKGGKAIYHYLETEIKGEASFIVLKEEEGRITFYSIVDKIRE